MSAPNFCTMDNFPLYVRDFIELFGYCSDCNLMQDHDNDCCEDCGGELEERSMFDDIESEYICSLVEKSMDDLNCGLTFHKLSLCSGYYTGVQFYVDELYDVSGMSNSDCRYNFDMCRSVALSKHRAEQRRIGRYLANLASKYGFDEYYCAGIFSNGEAIYHKVENTQHSRIRRAVSPVVA